MSDIRLTCAETPLSWPANVSVDDLKVCTSCGLRLHAPHSGSLQILTRRQGAGDGVNIDESISVGADYRGQRYSYEEAIFMTPGVHRFPGNADVYPAEYHIHMRTMSAPIRFITIVIPVSHMTGAESAVPYFAALKARPDPAAVRPTLSTLMTPGARVIQYQGPDIRGRTADRPNPEPNCGSNVERQFLLMLSVARIRASDLERIPREGSLSTDPRNLPAPGVRAAQVVPRDRLLRTATLAVPGILGPTTTTSAPVSAPKNEMECKPVRVVDGRDVVDIAGESVDIKTLLGLDDGGGLGATQGTPAATSAVSRGATMFIGAFLGLYIADMLTGKLWSAFFHNSARLQKWEPFKLFFFLTVAASAAGFSGGILGLIGL